MSVTVLYFAGIKESLDCANETIDHGNIATVNDLIVHLSQRGQAWQQTLKDASVLVAVNQTVANLETTLNDGDEVAFFPPVTGG